MQDDDKTKEQLIAELQQSRERVAFLEEVLDSINLVVQVMDDSEQGITRYVNRLGHEGLGLSREEVEGKPFFQFVPPEELEDRLRIFREHSRMEDGSVLTALVSVTDAQGRVRWAENSMTKKFGPPIHGFVGCIREVTDRVQAEAERREVQRTLEAIFAHVDEAIMVHDVEGRIVYCNKRSLEMFSLDTSINEELQVVEIYSRELRKGPDLPSANRCYQPAEHLGDIAAIWEQVLEGSDRVFEGRGLKTVAGQTFDAEIVLTSLPVKEQNFILAVIRDVTDRKRAERQIRNALREKEAMLRELHHRVKNNFAVISSLLNLQRRRVKDAGILAVLNETAFRIRCMGMVHEKLHQSESLKELSVREYLYGLLTNLREAYEGTHPGIELDAILEDVSFGVDKAIPVGFLTSELVSNAYKHAFPEGKSGTIRVALRPLGDSTYELVVADDGVGMPADLDLTNLPSLGMDLVLTFSKQLGGKLGISNSTGATVRIEFAV